MNLLSFFRLGSSPSLLSPRRRIFPHCLCVPRYGLYIWLPLGSIAGRSRCHISNAQSNRGVFGHPNPVCACCGSMHRFLFLWYMRRNGFRGRWGIISGGGPRGSWSVGDTGDTTMVLASGGPFGDFAFLGFVREGVFPASAGFSSGATVCLSLFHMAGMVYRSVLGPSWAYLFFPIPDPSGDNDASTA